MAFEWLNEDSRKFLSHSYVLPGQTVESRIMDIAKAAEKLLNYPGFADKFYDYMGKGYYSLSSPVWANFGNDRGLPISCNGVLVEDDMGSIFGKLGEVGIQTKHGAGTSGYFGKLRPRGAPIKDNGHSDGPVQFLNLFETATNVVSQGSVRRGAFAAYLNIDHPDIEEFLNIREVGHSIQNMSLGVTIPDWWMEEMIEEENLVKEKKLLTKNAQKLNLWAKILRKRKETGYPYLFFSDTVNDNKPQVLKDKNIPIWASNLCMTGDQRVVTSKGLLTAEELYHSGESLTLFDGEKSVKSSPMYLRSTNEKVYKITLANGMTHKVTSDHKVVVRVDRSIVMKKVSELTIGDTIAIQTNKGLFGTYHNPKLAFLLGLYQGDGTQTTENIHFDIWEKDFDLVSEVENSVAYLSKNIDDRFPQYTGSRAKLSPRAKNQNVRDCSDKKIRITSTIFKKCYGFEKGSVPSWIWEADEETIWQYIRGLLYSDGTVGVNEAAKGNPIQLNLASIDYKFLEEVQLIFRNLGLSANIHLLRKGGPRHLPDSNGDLKLYDTKDCFRLVVGNKNDSLVVEQNTGFLSRKNCIFENRDYRDNTKKSSAILSIEYVGEEPVYCPTVETDEHIFVANGVITGNCSEIMLPSSEEWSFVCNLSSLNLLKWNEWKDTDAVEVLTYFLDAVMSEYIKKTKDIPHMGPAYKFAKTWRALGIGQLGWHSFLQANSIAFESFEAISYATRISKFIDEKTLEASKEMAQRYGEPEGLVGYGVRNLTRCAVAPTTSSSFALGQVSPSIEPLPSNYFNKVLAKGNYTWRNPELAKVLEKYNQNTEETWDDIRDHRGSVQHLDYLTEHEKNVFKTFEEIVPLVIIQQAAARQKYIDQAQSLNLMIPHDTPIKDINSLIKEAWKLRVKTLYYQRSSNPSQELVRNILNCVACEA